MTTGWWESRVSGFEGHYIDRAKAERWLKDAESVWAVVHEWCGAETTAAFDERNALRVEADRLRRIIEEMVRWLRSAGHPVKAGLLAKELESGSRSESASATEPSLKEIVEP